MVLGVKLQSCTPGHGLRASLSEQMSVRIWVLAYSESVHSYCVTGPISPSSINIHLFCGRNNTKCADLYFPVIAEDLKTVTKHSFMLSTKLST